MRIAMPPVREQRAELKHRVQRAHDGQQKLRLHRLYLVASGQARTRQEVAASLGVHRQTIGRWVARDAVGGVDALLATDVPAGNPVSLAPVLRRPEGLASSEARRPWVAPTPHGQVQDKTCDTRVRTRVRSKRNVPRPRHPPNP